MDPLHQRALDLNERLLATRRVQRRAEHQLPVLEAEMAGGELDWTKAREIIRVATPDTEAAWIVHAKEVSCRVLEHDIARSQIGDLPPGGPVVPEPKPARRRIVIEMEAADAEIYFQFLVQARLRAQLNEEEVEDGVLVASM